MSDDNRLARDVAKRQARQYHAQVRRLDECRDALAQAVRMCVDAGMTEQATADHVGVTRLTVRKWLGKDKR